MEQDIAIRLPYWPAALDHKLAAAYCGLPLAIFTKFCPVATIEFPGPTPEYRYLRQRLDEWLLSLESRVPASQCASQVIEPDKRAFTPKRLAERWMCSERHVRNMIKRGDIPAFKYGDKLLRIKWEDVDAFESGRN